MGDSFLLFLEMGVGWEGQFLWRNHSQEGGCFFFQFETADEYFKTFKNGVSNLRKTGTKKKLSLRSCIFKLCMGSLTSAPEDLCFPFIHSFFQLEKLSFTENWWRSVDAHHVLSRKKKRMKVFFSMMKVFRNKQNSWEFSCKKKTFCFSESSVS